MIHVLEWSSLVIVGYTGANTPCNTVTVSQYDWYIGCPVSQPSCPSSSLQSSVDPGASSPDHYKL